MNNILLYNIVKSYILYTKFKFLTKRMFYHIESSPIETTIKINKLIKLESDQLVDDNMHTHIHNEYY